jgi:ATP-binding cassette subfamily B (MDR/TAP) protein 1
MTKYTQASSTHIADAGALAEEVFSSVRTAQAFGAQRTLVNLFDGYVKKSAFVGIKGARISSLGLATMFFVIYAGYALAFFYGGVLINQGRTDPGTVITVFLSVLIGV